jgi:hypothetical protein
MSRRHEHVAFACSGLAPTGAPASHSPEPSAEGSPRAVGNAGWKPAVTVSIASLARRAAGAASLLNQSWDPSCFTSAFDQ